MRHRRFLVTRALCALALAATLGADPAPTAKLVPTLVHAETQNVTITTAPLSANAPLNRLPLPAAAAITVRSVVAANPLAPASPSPAPGRTLTAATFAPPLAAMTATGPRTTASLSVVAPGGMFTTASLSAFAPGGTFPMVVAPLTAVAPLPGGGTVVTTSLNATAPGGIFTTASLGAFAPTALPPGVRGGPVIGPTGVRVVPNGANGGQIATLPLIAIAPGGTIATVSLSASAPGGTFSISVAPLSALGPADGGGTFPTQSLTANAPGGTITTTPLTAGAPQTTPLR
jgi:hypothetical protein